MTRVALVGPPWTFDRSVDFGCVEPHLPLELGYAQALLAQRGHEAVLFDAHLEAWSHEELGRAVRDFRPDLLVVTTAPTYLAWRSAPPELLSPLAALRTLAGVARATIAVGPHPSTTPRAALRKLGVDAVVVGECEEAIVELAETPRGRWSEVPAVICAESGPLLVPPRACAIARLPALRWPERLVARHVHHHQLPDAPIGSPSAELEASRGCPFHCPFCGADEYRTAYRKRPLTVVVAELDGLVAQGVHYAYFVDDSFMPDPLLFAALGEREVAFGARTRLDACDDEAFDALGRAGCVSLEVAVDSVLPEGAPLPARSAKRTLAETVRLLVHAKRCVSHVKVTLPEDNPDLAEGLSVLRRELAANGIEANTPAPPFPYPGSRAYRARWGMPDDRAWERAHETYLRERGEAHV